MSAKKAIAAEPENPEPFKIKKLPPLSLSARRRLEKAGQMTLPEIGATPVAVRKSR